MRSIQSISIEGDRGEKYMRAVVHDRYGDPSVLRIQEVGRPVPNENQVLVKILATTVTRSDCHWRSATPFISRFFTGIRRPKYRTLGSEFAGEIVAVGESVNEFVVGDEVFGTTGGFRANAEFICVRESAPIAHKPVGMSFQEAAAVCDGAILALNALRPTNLLAGQHLLVYGASGSIGTASVQLGKYFGAEVTAVCNTKNLELVKSLGADVVIDYTKEDFTKNGQSYDVIFDAVGKDSFMRCRQSLKKSGIFIPSDGFVNLAMILLTRWIGKKRVLFSIPPRYKKEDVLLLKELIETGRYRAVIDRSYPFEQVIDATRYVETGEKTGNVVLTIMSSERKGINV